MHTRCQIFVTLTWSLRRIAETYFKMLFSTFSVLIDELTEPQNGTHTTITLLYQSILYIYNSVS